MLDTPDIVLADIRDAERLDAVFAEHRPEVVFHAAALKHLPMLEQYPGEALEDQRGRHPERAAGGRALGVDRFVNISTDKAADPTSVLGYTKRMAERLTACSPRRSATAPTSRSGSATCWAVAGRCCTRSARRSQPVARSPSPTPTSPATS